jgi:hypothetical protein
LTLIQLENAGKGLCVVDGAPLGAPSVVVCTACSQPCEIVGLKPGVLDAKSKCCDADVVPTGPITCSRGCHETLIKEFEKEFGIYAKVIDHEGRAYRVPTRDIMEKGLREQDLHRRYPLWDSGVA